ncbi:MAG TPA: PilZ domain-containing protein [Candidatus Baltobacteraceae bacterium]|nr:PilZ domain-containing protein [Candidatus Baltobacteraceae bacterium]
MAFQTHVKTRGVAPAKAIVESITPTECVMRCVLLFDVNAPVEFEAHLPDRPPFAVQGRIQSRTPMPPRFEYRIALQPQPPASPAPAETRLEELGRKHQRYDAEFSLQYRTAKEGFRAAKGRNVSTGGLLMTCKESLVEGQFLELHFVLPSDVLAVYSFKKPSERSKLSKPFDDIVVQARVVHHRPLGTGLCAYGLNFVGLDRRDRDQITRFVDAVSRVKLQQIP